ncbi:hypothetical protein WJX72_007437 [[Myrmecia] bisecta]|uniref:NAD-dependent epimerase/dehydratase domain-containing protein n=1 Tax=[Myrmecia] bisecta TaxID=41462 RepID=A0AAW1P6N1_9CHLO
MTTRLLPSSLRQGTMTEPLRRPLYEIERLAEPMTVCVTGATGYIASSIVRRLLSAGHTVHGTCRDPKNAAKVAHLEAMPGATRHLKLFKADLMDLGSFDEAVAGCKYVMHVASPVLLNVAKGKEQERLFGPAVKGVENVISAVNKAGSVERVVLTSSIAAVYGDKAEKGPGHVFTEADWNSAAREGFLPYQRSKLLAERRAWELCEQQPAGAERKWTLVAINPSVVWGPPEGNIKCESVGMMRQILNGASWPVVLRVSIPFVDVDDVAAAHVLAMLTPEAQGRYIVSARTLRMAELIDLLRPEYSRHWLPWLPLPYWLVALLMRLKPRLANADLVRVCWGEPEVIDCSKDMAASLIALGIAKKC